MGHGQKYLRFISTVLGLILIFNAFGYFILFNPLKILIKEVVRKSLIENNISTEEYNKLVFCLNDLRNNVYDFVRINESELRFNGKLYDIKNQTIKGDSLYLVCYFDHNENLLESALSLFWAFNKKDIGNTNPVVFFAGLYYEEIENGAQIYDRDSFILPLLRTNNRFLNHIEDIPTPPPRLIV